MLIKLLLIVGVAGAAIFAMRGAPTPTNRALRRVAALGFAVCGTLAVLFPDGVTWLAEHVGVGRGTDLVLYALVIAFLFTAIGLYQRVQHLEERIARLARTVALREAPTPHTDDD